MVLAYYILLTLGNSLDYITNILLMQSPAQHHKIMPCQVGQLQGRCFLRLTPQCFNICLVCICMCIVCVCVCKCVSVFVQCLFQSGYGVKPPKNLSDSPLQYYHPGINTVCVYGY